MKISGNLDLDGGELRSARQQTYTSLPTFVAGSDEGRIIFVSTGADRGYWMGGEDGTSSFVRANVTSSIAEYDIVAQTVANGATYQVSLPSSTVTSQKAMICVVRLTASLVSGKVLVEIYNDVARTDRAYANYFDLASASTLKDNIASFFESDVSAGTMYVNVTNLTGVSGVFSLHVETASLLGVNTPSPPGSGSGIHSGVAGDGILYNGTTAQLEIRLDTNPGLQLLGTAGTRELSVLAAPAGGLSVGAGGVSVDSTVIRTTGAQSIAGNKLFTTGAGMTPAATTGAPVAGTWGAGTFYTDSANDVWYCLVGGTPGTWIFWGWKIAAQGGATNSSSYTASVGPGVSLDVALTVTGRRGVLRKMNVWVAKSTMAAANLDVPYRVSCFPDENGYGRDMLWSVSGQGRSTFMDAIAGAGSASLQVNTVNVAEPDDLLRLRQAAGPLEEYGRITVRDTTPPATYTVDENLVNALAISDLAMSVTEFVELPWWNTSAVPGNYQKLYLRFSNDHATETVKFGFHIFVESLGGGNPL
jgi:hypothetical protein